MKKKNVSALSLLKPVPPVKKVLTIFILGLCFVTLFLAVLPWQQTARFKGRVIAYSATERQQNISALVDGRLGQWYAQEGMMVKKGDKIVEIYDNDPQILANLQSEKNALELRYNVAKTATHTSNLNVNRQKALFQKGISSKRNLELAELEYAKFLSEEANIKAELARIQVRLSRQHGQLVLAPMDGMILRRMAGEGSAFVKIGDVLATLIPDTKSRAVEALVDGNDIPLVHVGQKVRLQFEGWPAIQFSGWPSVAIGTFGGIVSVVDNADNGMGMFRILVVPDHIQPWPDPKYLRQGALVHGWVLLSQVKIYYELWRQFNGFPPSVQENPE